MSSGPYDFWLLDLDGTLIDVEQQYIYDVMNTVGRRFGRSFSEWEAEMLWYGPSQSRATIMDRHEIDPEQFWQAFHEVEQPEKRAAASHLYSDTEQFIRAIDGPVGLVTHCQEFITWPVLKYLDIEDWFDTIVCCTDETGWKPDPEPVELAMADLGVDSDADGVLVGDDPSDVGAAWNAGLTGVHIQRRDPNRVGQCVRGDRRIESLDALLTGASVESDQRRAMD
ncbi:HAD-IA family hydrolase [Halovenus sp. WSH3]|uniref:HAD-IA family hydrolase n=1 Tax=Halovenus carboxidivorans TaxID=2692199 RepID=A0A6B0T3L0_9EURY|nr:HAD family hydrolase [Halovenus carboxidivorans]MXR52644.1 HAD-IA family hydrolase [Halovenus carboxidivorans]